MRQHSRPGASLADDLAAQRGLGRGRVVSADHGEELLVGDANRQQKLHVDPGIGELAKVAAPAPGTFSILTGSAGRSRYARPAPSSTACAAASSSAMNATTPLRPCVVAHSSRFTPLLAIASHSRASSPG